MTTQDTELHDLSDDANYAAASQQQGSASMVRSDSNISKPSDSEGAELVYVKENVTIHLSQSASERISGRLKLIKQWSSLLCHGFHTKGKTLMLVFRRNDSLHYKGSAFYRSEVCSAAHSSIRWTSFLDSEGRVMDSEALRKRIFYGGIEDELRKEVWPLLLGYQSYGSTYAERERQDVNGESSHSEDEPDKETGETNAEEERV